MALLAIGVIIFIIVLISLADNLIQIEAKKSGIDTEKTNMSLWPSIGQLSKAKAPAALSDFKYHKLKKGHNIKVAGSPSSEVTHGNVSRFAVRPTNFRGIAPIPKMLVEIGNEVKAGDALFFDKKNPDTFFVAPVSGEVIEINRGEKRAISEVVILADKEQSYKKFDVPNLSSVTRDDLVTFLKSTGTLGNIIQRPFGTIADASITPRDIFISAFDTAPLAPDPSILLDGRTTDFNKGIEVLSKLTDGKVFVSCSPSQADLASAVQNAEVHIFDGPHPAGNVGIQIHHIKQIKGSDVVWTMNPAEVLSLGGLFNNGELRQEKVVSLGGQVENPKHVRTVKGANIGELLQGQIKEDNLRIIAGDILTGEKVSLNQYLNANDDQISVIKEGDYYEPFGWLLPIKPRPSISATFPNFLFSEFQVDTNTHGEKRAFVVSGQYEKMLPMDIYPQHLMKAILTGNIERMEGLGINELLEEDVAVAEFACTSKQPLQELLRDGLDYLKEQV